MKQVKKKKLNPDNINGTFDKGLNYSDANKKFSLEMVRCIGCCALSPVIRVDERVYSRVRYNTVMDTLMKY